MDTTMEERIEIVERTEKGEPTWLIAHHLHCRPETVRKWRRRWRQYGREGLVSHRGRPKSGALSSFPLEITDTLVRWRIAHPGWGATTLLAELRRHRCFIGQELPNASSIDRFLQEREFSAPQERHSELADSSHLQGKAPHDHWEMDARGYQYVPDVGVVTLINLNDYFSRARLLSYPCLLGEKRARRHANTVDYQVVLRLAFTHWGLPSVLQVDHESVFFDNKTKSPFPTTLHLWLRALGIRLTFSRVRRPTDQAVTERSHQLWAGQVLEEQRFADWSALYESLQERRDFLNYHLPCASSNKLPPLIACPQAKHSGRAYRPEYEKELLKLQPVYDYLAQGKWFRRVSVCGTISLGGHTYYLGAKWQRQQLEIRCDAAKRKFVYYDESGNCIKRTAWKGDLRQTLMGELPPELELPSFQLHLPFAWKDIRLLHFINKTQDTKL